MSLPHQIIIASKKYWYLLVLSFIIFGLFIIQSVLPDQTSPPPPSTPPPSWQGLSPGLTSNQINQTLGRPINVSPGLNDTVRVEYKSDEKYYPHEVVYTKDVAELIIQRTLNSKPGGFEFFTNQYGDSPHILEPEEAHSNTFLYVWPEEGMAVKAHAGDGKVFEVWYFTPTNIDDFKANFSDIVGSPPPEGEF